MMKKCWRLDPDNRPTMAHLLEEMHRHLEKVSIDGCLNWKCHYANHLRNNKIETSARSLNVGLSFN